MQCPSQPLDVLGSRSAAGRRLTVSRGLSGRGHPAAVSLARRGGVSRMLQRAERRVEIETHLASRRSASYLSGLPDCLRDDPLAPFAILQPAAVGDGEQLGELLRHRQLTDGGMGGGVHGSELETIGSSGGSGGLGLIIGEHQIGGGEAKVQQLQPAGQRPAPVPGDGGDFAVAPVDDPAVLNRA